MSTLDTQWMRAYEPMANIHEVLQKESMKHIRAGFLYLTCRPDQDNDPEEQRLCHLLDVVYEDHVPLIDNYIPNDTILTLIQQKKRKHFSLQEILLYNVDLAPEHIQKFVQVTNDDQETENQTFLSKVVGSMSVFEPLYVPPSLPIFHNINVLLFVFMDRSSLSPSEGNKQGMLTKKVRFKLPTVQLKNKTFKLTGTYQGNLRFPSKPSLQVQG